ncbi:3'-5' exoribonuclease [Candidatus Parcubacteria bacterium]|nr:3'-5' exoribonuclease [Candidatus Parcubacteria bacterium]
MKLFSAEKPLAIVDVETTGASPQRDRVLEIAIIRVEQGKVVETFETILDPECTVQPFILQFTGIQEREIKKGPTFSDISKKVEELLKDAIFVAHNARFDHTFIKAEFARLGIPFSKKRLCTVELSRSLYPEYRKHDLSTLIDRFDFICKQRHRALGDAEVLADFLTHCENCFPEEKIQASLKHVLKRVRVPSGLPTGIIESLPESPGIYIFYGEDGEMLYIGKSINIRKRVISHFGNDASSRQLRLAHEVKDIEARTTAGELGALLLESYLIKKEQPLYNRMSRRSRKLVVVKEEIKEGYKHAVLETYTTEDISASPEIIGIFKSLSQAKKALDALSIEYKLCPRLLGLEQGKGPCFYSQLGRCDGACKGAESEIIYNARFNEAFRKRRVKVWPFSGPILINEKNGDREGGQAFVIHEWRLVNSYTYDEAGQSPFLTDDFVFDFDSYKILAQYISRNKKQVKLLTNLNTVI